MDDGDTRPGGMPEIQYSAARFVSYPDALSAIRAASCSRVHGQAKNDGDVRGMGRVRTGGDIARECCWEDRIGV